jgi:hypothetical protein
MKKIDSGFDNILNSNYELYSIRLFDLKTLAKSWYNVKFKEFDNRYVRRDYDCDFLEMKRSGIICNYFFAYREDDKYFILDGFNRLFTDYGVINVDTVVYLKILTDKLPDNQLMSIAFSLNMWKLQKHVMRNFSVDQFFDRGLRLFLYSKFNITLDIKNSDNRKRYCSDVKVLEKYFQFETEEYCGDLSLSELKLLFSHENIINDIKNIIESNDYLVMPFAHYDTFLEGFVMFLSWKRIHGDNSDYKFKTYLELLYKDTKFFKKLVNMSSNDSTRKNVYRFYRNLAK